MTGSMAYKNIEDRKAAARRHYEANKDKVKARSKQSKDEIRHIIREAKDKPCADCGVLYPYYVMDFDHLGFEIKEGNIALMVNTHGRNAVVEEIKKCDVVCSNCHRIRTHERAQR